MIVQTGFAELLSAEVESEESVTDAPESVLLEEEITAIASSVPKRRAEFATVRDCARRAMSRLGQHAVPILPGPNREPQWPQGIVGSLTHCEGYRAAAVAFAAKFSSIGIDVELNAPLPDGVASLVTTAKETLMLSQIMKKPGDICWDRLLFSAKESIYKAWFPLARRWLDFTECELSIDTVNGRFSGALLVPGPILGGREIRQFTGHWAINKNHLLTAVEVPFEPC